MTEKALSARSGRHPLGAVVAAAGVLIPVVAGAVLITGLAVPAAHIDRIRAAVVNNDVPVTLNGKSLPLGRQFAAGLISGDATPADDSKTPAPSDAASRNLTWVLTNDKDAASGLDSGEYAAVLTIPPTFSADATSSTGSAAQAVQADIYLNISPSAPFLDPFLAEIVTQGATTELNRQITAQYLDQVYDGFTSLHDQIGQAASGADDLASSTSTLSSGASSLAQGTSALAGGAASLATGATSLSNGLNLLRRETAGLPASTAALADGASKVADATHQVADKVDGATTAFASVVDTVCALPGPGRACDDAKAALKKLHAADTAARTLADGASTVAVGNRALADAMPSVVGGIDSAADGAAQVASGAAQTSKAAGQVDEGARQLSSGAAQVDSGAQQLAGGLDKAVQQIPTYSDQDKAILSTVVAQPVVAARLSVPAGAQSVPLFTVVALWAGGMVLALVRRSVPAERLMTTEGSWPLALRSLGVAAMLGAAQGLLVAPLGLVNTGVDLPSWSLFAGMCVLVGAVSAVVNQGLVAAFGIGGRAIALLIAVATLAGGLAGTVPPALTTIADLLPTAPALIALRASFAGHPDGTTLGVVGCLLFAIVAIALTVAGVAARRSVRFVDIGDPAAMQQHTVTGL